MRKVRPEGTLRSAPDCKNPLWSKNVDNDGENRGTKCLLRGRRWPVAVAAGNMRVEGESVPEGGKTRTTRESIPNHRGGSFGLRTADEKTWAQTAKKGVKRRHEDVLTRERKTREGAACPSGSFAYEQVAGKRMCDKPAEILADVREQSGRCIEIIDRCTPRISCECRQQRRNGTRIRHGENGLTPGGRLGKDRAGSIWTHGRDNPLSLRFSMYKSNLKQSSVLSLRRHASDVRMRKST
ncbi:MAG: hypothetical protein JWO82_2338 [Akkermansiaceae bacterium]|nr:hypothetical protein [Akkermansiaceae bacterium]